MSLRAGRRKLQPELMNVRGDDQCLLITLIGSNCRARPSGRDSPRVGGRGCAGGAGAASWCSGARRGSLSS